MYDKLRREHRLLRKIIYGLVLAVLSAWVTVTLLNILHPNASVDSRAAIPAPTPTISTPKPVPVKPLATLYKELEPLRHTYQTATAASVDELVAQEDTEPTDSLGYMPTSSQFEVATPLQYQVKVHPTNFGERLNYDIKKRPIKYPLLVVLHETTSSASSAVHQMLTPHFRDEEQVSYHTIVRRDGAIIYAVDPNKRAYGAGNSAFKGDRGLETVQTRKGLAPSVNNFSYHISLETPPDGYDSDPEHSGYTSQQYQSLAWLVAQAGVAPERIVTHVAVDQSGERQDPRSFEMARLQQERLFQPQDTDLSLNPPNTASPLSAAPNRS
jgi:N-acetyl-anhydromuramyl-L-alanine amidase AmpD